MYGRGPPRRSLAVLTCASMEAARERESVDRGLLVATIFLLILGCVIVLDASYVRAMNTKAFGYDPYYFFKRQVMRAGLSLVALAIASRFPYWRLRRFWLLGIAVSVVPGWHVTLMPTYFVAGAIFSGFAMVMTLAIPLRAVYNLEDFITLRHLSNMAKVMLTTGLIVAYGYLMEVFYGWYSGNEYEWALVMNRFFGPYAPAYWSLILCNVLIPQLLWFRAVRRNVLLLFVISIIINIGMWLERFVIIVVSLHRDFLPSSWEMYYPTVWDFAQFIGSIGLFLTLLFLFIRFLSVISIFELRELVHETSGEHDGENGR